MATALSETANISPALRPDEHVARLPLLRLLRRVMSFPACVVFGFAVFVYLLVPQSVADPDIWWHLRNAEWQLHATPS